MVQAIDDVVNKLAQFVELTPCPKESSESTNVKGKRASIHKVFMYENGRAEQARVAVDYNRLIAILRPSFAVLPIEWVYTYQDRIKEFDPLIDTCIQTYCQTMYRIDVFSSFVYQYIRQRLALIHKPSKLPAVDSAFEESVDIHLLDINQFCDTRIRDYIDVNKDNINYVGIDSVQSIEEAEKMWREQDFYGALKLGDQKLGEGYTGLLSLSISFKNPEVIPCIDYSKNKNCFTVSAAPIFFSGSFEFVKHLMRSNAR